ncbi:hypothetical protein [Paenimyroides aestuarii]|uniref:Uncharacterized protein n=1 Tax=Paenimyroides aestuarii TaxID=2968490 RepID=A0ABY5NNY3_9FLAO|nr:hypothetical protein [Paenimyroides aestuarii]UUV20238.1 hypothetical protein NPX36_07625 [Paenimyroides aestuarii]
MTDFYKKALKAYYETEKEKAHNTALINPTPAGLRDLFVYQMEKSTHASDRDTFEQFLGFSYEKNAVNKIKAEIDKFRPIVNFLKDKSDLTEIKRLNALAVLLNYPNRPFTKFSHLQKKIAEVKESENEEVIENPAASYNVVVPESPENDETETNVEEKTPETVNEPVVFDKIAVVSEEIPKKSRRNNHFKKIGIVGILSILILISVFMNIKNLTAKDCMVWKEEKYVAVDCKEVVNSFTATAVPKDDQLIKEFRKLKVDTKTLFFDKKGNPKIWYIKNPNGTLEFYNKPGLQPETGKTLKPVSRYIIQEYVLNENK